jgi:hypothetical protein
VSSSASVFSATHGLVQTHPSLGGSSGSSITRSQGGTSSSLIGGSPKILSSNAGSSASGSSGSGAVRPGSSFSGGGFPASANPSGRTPFKHLDYSSSATNELRRNPSLSAPDECARACREGEPPRICYYHFTLEYYTVLGA